MAHGGTVRAAALLLLAGGLAACSSGQDAAGPGEAGPSGSAGATSSGPPAESPSGASSTSSGGSTGASGPASGSSSSGPSGSGTASGSASPGGPTSSPPVKVTTGTVRLTVRLEDDARCAGARIGVHNTTVTPIFGRYAVADSSGSATFTVPGRKTRGLAIDVTCKSWPFIDAVPVVVLQYKGDAPGGSAATRGGHPSDNYASYCWAGATSRTATIRVTGWVKPETNGKPFSGDVILWADPTVATAALSATGERWNLTFDGGMAHQDLPYC